jgi:hypothetical protein
MDDVIAKLRKAPRGAHELGDKEEEEAAEAMMEAAERCPTRTAMVWTILAAKALRKAHDASRVKPKDLIDVTDALLAAELDDE